MPIIWLLMYAVSACFFALMGLYIAPGLYIMIRGVAHNHGLKDSFVAGAIVTGLSMWSTNWGWPIWGVLLFILGLTALFAVGMGDGDTRAASKAEDRIARPKGQLR